MDWAELLNATRIRPLLEGGKAVSKSPTAPVDVRTEFQRDFDRLTFSSAFRRLQDKTQVFPLDPSDAVRTRLTHSLEVSSMARGIGQAITDTLNLPAQQKADIITICQTVGLIHDLGNPSFGHAGEKAIQEWFERRKNETATGEAFEHLSQHTDHPIVKDFLQFEGNAQTIRLLSHLQILADDFGMNVTAATLSAALKYTGNSSETEGEDHGDHRRSKPGYHFSELDVVSAVRKATGVVGKSRHPITFIAEAADDCVYSMVDFEDAVRKQVISWKEACHLLPDLAEKECGPASKEFIHKLLTQSQDYIDYKLSKSNATLSGNSLDDAYAQSFRNSGALFVVNGCKHAFLDNQVKIMNGDLRTELSLLNDEARYVINPLKRLGREHIYATRQNLELELRGRRILQELMTALWEGISAYDVVKRMPAKPKKFAGKAWALISGNYRSVFERAIGTSEKIAGENGLPVPAYRQYLKLLLLTDYVSGMTDSYACRLHGALFND